VALWGDGIGREPPYHALDAAAVAATLGVDPPPADLREAAARAERSGPNALEEAKREPVWRMVLEAFTEPFVLMLAGAGLLAVLVGEVRDGLLVLVGLLPIVGADVVTEYRGERALEALRDATAPTARVRRDGRVATVQAATLVPGDVVLLQGGDVVPADARITRADRLLIDRSALTGESIPEEARVEADAEDAPLTSRHAIAYSGTSVVGGRGEGVVVAIGGGTEFGRIAGSLASKERRRSPLQRELDRLVRILLVVAIGLIAFTMGMGFLRGHPLGENVLAGISAAIAAIPEEPPVLLAVILGLGAYRLLKRGVLVRRLNAEETLGAVDLIVTDKTARSRRTACWSRPSDHRRARRGHGRAPHLPRRGAAGERTPGPARRSQRDRSRVRCERRSPSSTARRRSTRRPSSRPRRPRTRCRSRARGHAATATSSRSPSARPRSSWRSSTPSTAGTPCTDDAGPTSSRPPPRWASASSRWRAGSTTSRGTCAPWWASRTPFGPGSPMR
jgi:hypothetical protein